MATPEQHPASPVEVEIITRLTMDANTASDPEWQRRTTESYRELGELTLGADVQVELNVSQLDQDKLDTSIEDLFTEGLPPSVRHLKRILMASNIFTMRSVLPIGRQRLLAIPTIGNAAVDYLDEAITNQEPTITLLRSPRPEDVAPFCDARDVLGIAAIPLAPKETLEIVRLRLLGIPVTQLASMTNQERSRRLRHYRQQDSQITSKDLRQWQDLALAYQSKLVAERRRLGLPDQRP